MHKIGRSYVYASDYCGSSHHDRGYFLHGACGEEVVGSQESKKIFDVFIQGENFCFALLCFTGGETRWIRMPASIGAITISPGRNFI